VSGSSAGEGRTVCLRAILEFFAWQVRQFLAEADHDD
jgi:hypothetical protein